MLWSPELGPGLLAGHLALGQVHYRVWILAAPLESGPELDLSMSVARGLGIEVVITGDYSSSCFFFFFKLTERKQELF